MRPKTLVSLTLGILFVAGPSAFAQGQDDDKGGRVVTNANTSREEGGMQPSEAAGSGAAADKSKGGAPSPDEILERMGAGSSAQPEDARVEAESNPALLPQGDFQAGRDIFENIFQNRPEEGPVVEGLPGMRIEEVTLTGIMTGAFGTLAMFLAKDSEIYTAREGQKFANGRLAQITGEKVVFEQEVIDEFGKRRPPIVREFPLHTEAEMATSKKVKKGRGQ